MSDDFRARLAELRQEAERRKPSYRELARRFLALLPVVEAAYSEDDVVLSKALDECERQLTKEKA